MPASYYKQELYDSATFLESAGCILFDFRRTGIDPFKPATTPLTNTLTTPSTPLASSANSTTEPKIILIYSTHRNQYILPKGRRNISESRADAALRETDEETGLRCSLLPIILHSRATSADPADDRTTSQGYTIDEPRTFERVKDPFMVMLRYVDDEAVKAMDDDEDIKRGVRGRVAKGVKFVWWFVGVVDEVQNEDGVGVEIDPGCKVVWVPMSEASQRCSWADDRRVVEGAVRVVRETLGL